MKMTSMQDYSKSMARSREEAKKKREENEKQELLKLGNEWRQRWESALSSITNAMELKLKKLEHQANPRSMSNRILLGVLVILTLGVLGNLAWTWNQHQLARKIVLGEMGLEMRTFEGTTYLFQDPGMEKPVVFTDQSFPNQWIIKLGE